MTNPTSTDSEKNCATRPSLSRPATTETTPASRASAAVSTMKSGESGAAIRLTVAKDIVAMTDDTATTRWRDEPKTANASRPIGAA